MFSLVDAVSFSPTKLLNVYYIDSLSMSGGLLPIKNTQGKYVVTPEILVEGLSWWGLLVVRDIPSYLNPDIVAVDDT